MSATLAIGTPVVRCGDGARLGTINRLYLDPRRRALVGFAVRSPRRLLRSSMSFVDLGDVHAVGPNVVTLAPTAKLRSLEATERWRQGLIDVGALLGRVVVTVGGTSVGRVVAVGVDPTTYQLGRLDVAAPGYLVPGLVWGDEVMHCGTDRIVVADAVLAPSPALAWRDQPTTMRRIATANRRRIIRYDGRRRFLASA